MDIYQYNNHLKYIAAWLKDQPNEGRGIPQKLAKELRVSTVLISQILRGTRTLQIDHAYTLASFIGLNNDETEYFLTLVQYDQATTHAYKEHLKNKIDKLHTNLPKIKNRIAKDIQLSEEAKARFYSHWHYSAIRLMTDIPGKQTPQKISEALDIKKTKVQEILDFLVENGLCKLSGGKYSLAVKSTYLEPESPWTRTRLLQWKQKAIQNMELENEDSIFFHALMSISEKDKMKIREKIVQMVKEISDKTRNSPSEKLVCLNIDWFEV